MAIDSNQSLAPEAGSHRTATIAMAAIFLLVLLGVLGILAAIF